MPSWANFIGHKVHFPPLVLKITLDATVLNTFVGVCSVNISTGQVNSNKAILMYDLKIPTWSEY